MIVLIGGGSRSGKSRYALDYARRCPPPLTFLATAEPLDDEMRARIASHRAERSDEFETVEAPFDIASSLPSGGTCVVDCLTLWTSNLMLAGLDVRAHADQLVDAANSWDGTLILVTNEVGCGIVPDNELSRRFRDEAGWLNQRIASVAAEVYWMIFGCALRVK